MLATRVGFSFKPIDSFIFMIEIEGDLNSSVEKQLMDAYSQAQGSQVRVILLDFQKLDFMNSSGIGLLITLLIRANRQGQRLAACGLNPHFHKIFTLTRLQEAIPVFADVTEALASLRAVEVG